ncbi:MULTISPECIES: hypothetical protein [Roseobacteraceae]|uniref:Uncharacterized protein n=1 Tax=Leisingera aquaemixtae TaxID=1396826 RepID=A0A0P1H8N9_9RHOB|nr:MULTISPECIES: hypothetical protein [Roseobacteraceae]UWR68096.1 hypothetical protein K4K95_15405 [Phaeobacter inhibens]CUH99422.1 hypothetical protein PHA8399_01543 [Leisingera aquaemixtae]
MSSAKIRIKVASMELEYEGDPSFLTGGIEELLTTMGDLSTRVPKELTQTTPATTPATNATSSPESAADSYNFSTNTIAAHLDAKTGPELIICALAQLELVQGKPSSVRTEILTEMKGATTYYNENMRSNMTKSLGNLTKAKRINQVAKDTYSLSASERKQVEAKVANIE